MKQYTTRDGRKVRIYANGKDTKNGFIHGAILASNPIMGLGLWWEIAIWCPNGVYWGDMQQGSNRNKDLGSASTWTLGL